MNKNALLIPVLLFSLAGCTLIGGGDGGPGDGSGAEEESSGGEGTSEELEGGSTACIMDRNWSLDVDDAAEKLAAYMLETESALSSEVTA